MSEPWSEFDTKELIRMRDNGSSWESISEELERSQDECKERYLYTSTPQVVSGLERTSEGLRDTLFDAMDRLLSGSMDAAEAKAVCGISQSICDTVRLEMEARRLQESLGGARPNSKLKLGSK
jgi:hypothetical protein